MSGPIESRIREKLQAQLAPLHLEVENESYKHSVPKGSETHFRVVVVSEKFDGLSRIQRQRLVNEILKDEMGKGGVHALTQKAMVPSEWQAAGGAVEFNSPDCMGGSKADQ